MPQWKKTSGERRLEILKKLFDKEVKRLGLGEYLESLSFQAEKGYEEAFASFHKEKKKIFLNPKFIDSDSLKSMAYYFMHNGLAYRFSKKITLLIN